MSHICYEGRCASNPKQQIFSSIRALRQHQYKSHEDTPEEETSLGNARMLKRKRDAEEEEERKRQRLEAQLALEMASREPEPPLVWLMDHFQKTKLLFTLHRSRCWNVLLTLDFHVRRELGGFPHVSETRYRHQRHQSTSAFLKEKRLKHHSPLLPILRHNLKTSHTPQEPILLGYLENTPSFPPTTRAIRTLSQTFLQRQFLSSPSPLDPVLQ